MLSLQRRYTITCTCIYIATVLVAALLFIPGSAFGFCLCFCISFPFQLAYLSIIEHCSCNYIQCYCESSLRICMCWCVCMGHMLCVCTYIVVSCHLVVKNLLKFLFCMSRPYLSVCVTRRSGIPTSLHAQITLQINGILFSKEADLSQHADVQKLKNVNTKNYYPITSSLSLIQELCS